MAMSTGVKAAIGIGVLAAAGVGVYLYMKVFNHPSESEIRSFIEESLKKNPSIDAYDMSQASVDRFKKLNKKDFENLKNLMNKKEREMTESEKQALISYFTIMNK